MYTTGGITITGGMTYTPPPPPSPFNGFNTPATMNGSTTVYNMYSVAVNSTGLFVAVGSNGSNYPLYATSK